MPAGGQSRKLADHIWIAHQKSKKKKKPAIWQVYKFGKLLPNYILPLARFLVLKIL